MNQSSTLDIGLDVHKTSIAVAYAAKDHDATSSTSAPSARDTSTSISSSAGFNQKPHTSSLSTKLAPVAIGSLAVNTDRRDAVPLARLMRSARLWPHRGS
jgi:hypothetical protein